MPKKKEKFIDDGRVISSMNVDGMPWYAPKTSKPTVSAKPDEESNAAFTESNTTATPLTFGESVAFTWGVMKAALLVGFVFIGTLFAFILFCTNVWFR